MIKSSCFALLLFGMVVYVEGASSSSGELSGCNSKKNGLRIVYGKPYNSRLDMVGKIRYAIAYGEWLLAYSLIEKHEIHQDSKDMFLRDAVRGANVDVVKLLVQKNARIFEKDHLDKTALDYANETGNDEIIRLLLQKELSQAA